MYVGIHIQVLIPHGIEHHERLLRGSRIIKIDQRLLINLATQNREIFAYLIYIVHILFTKSATITLVELTPETLLHQIVQAITEGLELHLVDHFVDEGIL